jgi:CSLREA domain-containing protein
MNTSCSRLVRWTICLILTAAFLAAPASRPVQAQGSSPNGLALVVDTTADELTKDGLCSLREAILAANTHATVDTCTPGLAMIVLPAGTYALTLPGAGEDEGLTGDLDLQASLVLQGAGPGGTIIDGGGLDRVLDVHAGITVTITGLTIANGQAPGGGEATNGSDGGGIANAGNLTLQDCAISRNQAGSGGGDGNLGGQGGGIYNAGELTLLRSTVSDNRTGDGGNAVGLGGHCPADGGGGGGIYNAGTLTVRQSTIHGNATGDGGSAMPIPPSPCNGRGGGGGGIYNAGTAWIEGSTLDHNQTGKGVDYGSHYACPGDGGSGGGLANWGALTLRNSTISANQTGQGGDYGWFCAGYGGFGGGISNADTLQADNLTVADNQTGRGGIADPYFGAPPGSSEGGGIWTQDGGASRVRDVILAGNRAFTAGPDCRGALISAGYNLIQDARDCSIDGDESHDITGRDARLRTLADNGGFTWTQAPALNSPAVDAGSCTDSDGGAIATDQRGTARPQGAACDIGAYEGPVARRYMPVVSR